MKALHYLHDDRSSDAADLLDSIGRLAVLAMANINDLEGDALKYLVSVLGDFYEVEPLGKILQFLTKDKAKWAEVQTPLLDANNFVLRYGMAEALADAWIISEIIKLLLNAKTLNEFELAGYALGLAYARKPKSIDPKLLAMLANRPAYSGCTILGDLFLSLVFRKDRKGTVLEDLTKLGGPNFWASKWNFIQLDVQAIKAAQALVDGRYIPSDKDGPEFSTTLKNLRDTNSDLDGFKRNPRFNEKLQTLRAGYFSLGENPNSIREAYTELESLDRDDLKNWMRVLFSHPTWSVAESAATVLSTMIDENEDRRPERLSIILELLAYKKNWRVRFGAHEAAFAVRHIEFSLFEESVKICDDADNAKITGLRAENLLSYMLNSSNDKRSALYTTFREEISGWIRSDDCWVLEHVHRFFHKLDQRGTPLIEEIEGRTVEVDLAAVSRDSPLLSQAANWHKLERDEFLALIEREKEKARGETAD